MTYAFIQNRKMIRNELKKRMRKTNKIETNWNWEIETRNRSKCNKNMNWEHKKSAGNDKHKRSEHKCDQVEMVRIGFPSIVSKFNKQNKRKWNQRPKKSNLILTLTLYFYRLLALCVSACVRLSHNKVHASWSTSMAIIKYWFIILIGCEISMSDVIQTLSTIDDNDFHVNNIWYLPFIFWRPMTVVVWTAHRIPCSQPKRITKHRKYFDRISNRQSALLSLVRWQFELEPKNVEINSIYFNKSCANIFHSGKCIKYATIKSLCVRVCLTFCTMEIGSMQVI